MGAGNRAASQAPLIVDYPPLGADERGVVALGLAGTAIGPTATTTGQMLTTLIAAFGALGMTAKLDAAARSWR